MSLENKSKKIVPLYKTNFFYWLMVMLGAAFIFKINGASLDNAIFEYFCVATAIHLLKYFNKLVHENEIIKKISERIKNNDVRQKTKYIHLKGGSNDSKYTVLYNDSKELKENLTPKIEFRVPPGYYKITNNNKYDNAVVEIFLDENVLYGEKVVQPHAPSPSTFIIKPGKSKYVNIRKRHLIYIQDKSKITLSTKIDVDDEGKEIDKEESQYRF